jgi:hypothetical protein
VAEKHWRHVSTQQPMRMKCRGLEPRVRTTRRPGRAARARARRSPRARGRRPALSLAASSCRRRTCRLQVCPACRRWRLSRPERWRSLRPRRARCGHAPNFARTSRPSPLSVGSYRTGSHPAKGYRPLRRWHAVTRHVQTSSAGMWHGVRVREARAPPGRWRAYISVRQGRT